ncbi:MULTISPECIES: helix-turn-helix transcriptional regulator [unclassified Sporosarcina]|uniref:ArsR/SmtB family transcription factor n=1 Tax=unclassified Sporosarcina TaxID=2647733 RepID=UPI00204231F9|nr:MULTISPECIES: metalloregulator ArsR/SmtB family transcription factor [unclassified Sporosarcina]GKV66974.1 transcription regulator ArsR [Sporosarcina sp. NCCP-2331]GLB57269.1 transcription regulator ArsR [Sporosarcina sp. NCCP-2378]
MTEKEEVREADMLSEDLEQDVASLFSALSNPTRIKILYLLKQQSLTVTQICDRLDVSQSAVSHQLRELKFARLVRNHKHGREMIYQLDDDHVHQIFEVAIEHVKEIYHYE